MANRRYEQFFYSMHKKPVHLDCSFSVDNTNTSGVSGLVGGGISSVYMHSAASFSGDTHTNTTIDNIADTSVLSVGMSVYGSGIPEKATIAAIPSSTSITLSAATTATASGVTITYAAAGSPQPAAGLIQVNFQDCFNWFYEMSYDLRSPNSGSALKIDNNAIAVGSVYTISTVGDASLAKWQSIGLPVGTTPAIGVSFVATSAGGTANASTSRVMAPAVAGSGISRLEIVGNPQKSIMSSAAQIAGRAGGSYILLRALGAAALGTHTHDLLLKNAAVADGATTRVNAGANLLGANTGSDLTITGSGANGGIVAASAGTPSSAILAPANGTVIDLKFLFSSSRITVQGD